MLGEAERIPAALLCLFWGENQHLTLWYRYFFTIYVGHLHHACCMVIILTAHRWFYREDSQKRLVQEKSRFTSRNFIQDRVVFRGEGTEG